MPLDELLQRWVKVTPGQKLFLSAYLDLRPDRSGKKLYPIFLKDHLPELFHLLPPHSPERAFLTQDIKRLQKYLEEDLDPAGKGIALFVCSSDDLFVSIPCRCRRKMLSIWRLIRISFPFAVKTTCIKLIP